MKTAKRLFTLALVVIMALSCFITPASAASTASFSYDKEVTFYTAGANSSSWEYIYISRASAAKKVTKVTSSNKAVVSIESLQNGSYDTDKYNTDGTTSSSGSYNAQIGLIVKKAGTATIKFTYNSKTYSIKVTVKNYVNPVSSITMTGVNSGNSFASKTKSDSYFWDLKLTKASTAAKLKVTAKDGWKITSISFSDETTGRDVSIYSYNGAKTMTLYLGPTKTANSYYIYVNFINTANNATAFVSYGINQ